MYLHLRGCHVQLKPPEPYHTLFRDDPLPYVGGGYSKKVTSEAEGAAFRDAYDQTARWYDDAIGRLLAELKTAGLADKTFVLLTADHGTGLGDVEKGPYDYGWTPYENVLRVPMVLVGPGLKAGTVVPAPVQQIDVVYTVLSAMGVEAKPSYHWRATDLRKVVPDVAVSYAIGRLSVRDTTHRLDIELETGRERFYAHAAEDREVPASEVPGAERLLAAARRVRDEAAALNAHVEAKKVAPDAADVEALRKLGYVE